MHHVSNVFEQRQALNLNNAHVVKYKAHLHIQTEGGSYEDHVMNTRFFEELEYAIYPLTSHSN